MKKIILALLGAAMLPAMSFAGKTFEVDFDDYGVAPGIAGDKRVYRFKDGDLQLRMFPGVNGKGNSLNLANSECVEYLMPKNFNPKGGTVSIWVCPINWQLYGEGWQTFFFAWQKDFQLRINKLTPGYIEATIVNRPAGDKQHALTAVARCDAADWAPGRWHKIDVTWDEEKISLYIDGKIPQKTPDKIGKNTRVRPTNPIRLFRAKQNYPDASGRFCIGTRYDWQTRKEVNRTHKTAIDKLTIRNRVLGPVEIRKEYEMVIPPAPVQAALNFAAIPCQQGDTPDWSKALKMPIAAQLAPAPHIPAYIMLAHNNKNLFVKYFVGKAPLKTKTPATVRDGKLWEDDSVEFHFHAPGGKQQNQYIFNSAGAIYDSCNTQVSWNGKATVKPEIGKDFWTLEAVIPLDDLGGKDLLTGKDCQAEFCISIHDRSTIHYYHWGNYTGRVYQARDIIHFNNDDSYFQLDADPLKLNTGNLKISGKGDLKGDKVTAGITPDGYSTFVYPADFNGVTWERTLPAGKQRLAVESKKFKFYCNFAVDYPLELRHSCNPADKKLKLEIDLTNAGSAVAETLRKGVISGTAKLLDPTGKTVSNTGFTLKNIKDEITLALPADLIAGTYTIEAATTGKGTSFTRQIPFRVPDLTPYKVRLGMDHSVPDPWLPLKDLGNDRYQTLTNTIQLSGNAFPTRITHGDTELLLAPPAWNINGTEVKWDAPKRSAIHQDFAVYTGRGTAGDLALEWKGELWFDGAWIVNIDLIPLKKNAEVKSFNVSYKLPAVAGKFAMDPIYVPFKDEVAIGLGGDARRKDNILWLSGHEKGVFFWTKSNANWVNNRDEKPLTAKKDPSGTSARINIISRPVKMPGKASYTMVFMGTPSRVPMKEHRLVNYNGYLRNSHCNYQPINFGYMANAANPSDMTALTSCIPAYREEMLKFLAPYKARKIKNHIYTMPGQVSDAVADYDYIGRDNWSSPRLNHSGIKLGKPWILDYFCFNATDLTADLWSYNIDKTMKEYPIEGLYYDVASTKFCENITHGCGGKDIFGQPYITSDALGLRNFLMRTYKTVHKNNGSILLHSHVQFLPMSHAFIDIFAPGENTFHIMAKNLDYGYCEEIPLEQYQTDFNWVKAGVPYTLIIQSGRLCRFTPAFKKERARVENSPEFALRALAPAIIHDFNTWPTFVYNRTVNNWWFIREHIGLGSDEVEFHGYWENTAAVPTAPKTYCSYYKINKKGAPYRVVLMISNFNRTPVKAAMKIDFAALGVETPQAVTNIWKNKEIRGQGVRDDLVKVSEIGNIDIPGNHFLLIGIK